MVGVREHVYRLNGLHFIFRIEQLQVARLRSRITADVYDAFGFGKQNDIHYILVHSGTGRESVISSFVVPPQFLPTTTTQLSLILRLFFVRQSKDERSQNEG